MKITERSFILVTESSERIIIDDYLEEMLRKEMRPILWFRDGLFCVIQSSILENALATIDVMKKGFDTHCYTYVHWSQGEPISHNAGHSLAQVDYTIDDKGTNNGS